MTNKSYPPHEKMEHAIFHEFHAEWGLSYQSCRFCGAGVSDKERIGNGLWKYAVRHYICGPCRETAMTNPVGRMSV